MISTVKRIIKNLIPASLRSSLALKIHQYKHERFLKDLRTDILKHYDSKPLVTAEETEVVDYLKENPIALFPYSFQHKYSKAAVEVLKNDSGLPYVMHEGKKLYFKRSFSDNYIRSLYYGLQLDQDKDSPHLYLTDKFKLTAEDVIADIGGAEGNFSLSNVERVKKIYIFECDPGWIEALEATFEPWKNKVVIVNKFVSNVDSDTAVSLDTFSKTNNDITFLKVDIEGEEANFLEGAKGLLSNKPDVKIAICTYHKQDDEKEFTAILKKHQFDVKHSERFMIFYYHNNIKAPYLRRGLLRAQKMPAI